MSYYKISRLINEVKEQNICIGYARNALERQKTIENLLEYERRKARMSGLLFALSEAAKHASFTADWDGDWLDNLVENFSSTEIEKRAK